MIQLHHDENKSDSQAESPISDLSRHKLDLLFLASEVCHRRMVTAQCESDREYYKWVGFKLCDAMDSIALPQLSETARVPVVDLPVMRLASNLVRVHIAQMETNIEAVERYEEDASAGTMHWQSRSHRPSLLFASLSEQPI